MSSPSAVRRPAARTESRRRVTLRHPAAGVLLLSLACFAALAAAVALVETPALDLAIRNGLLALANPALVGFLEVANRAGDKHVLVPAVALFFLVFRRARERWWVWVVLMVAAPLLEGLLKELFERPRPEGGGLAFPSGHATAAAAFFGAVFYAAGALDSPRVRMAARTLALVAMILVALARVVLRAHWPSDVLAGAALGLALASAAALMAGARYAPAEEG